MQRFRNILLADFTTAPTLPPAIHEASALARTNNAKLTLYTVVPEPPLLQRALRFGSHRQPLPELLAEQRRQRLREFADALDHQPINVHVGIGPPTVELIRHAIHERHDLVIVTTDGTEDSTATIRRILRLCPIPVWVLRPGFTGSRILAAIDPDDDPNLNQLILELAQSQAERYDGELHVVHSWEPYGATMMPELLHAYAYAAEAAHREAFDRTLATAHLPSGTHSHLVGGTPLRSITGLINLYRIDLLVMGSVGRAGLDGIITGNTAEQLFKEVDCSVLVVKPPGFVSPINVEANP